MAAERVLILDDEETLRFVLHGLVSGLGHEALTVGTIAEALARVSEQQFSVALLDLVLPDGSGIQVLEAIKQTAPDTEVIVMTGHASVETAVSVIRIGAYDYIEKPCDLDVVTAVITRALEKRALLKRNQQLVQDLEQQNAELAATVKRLNSLNAAGTGASRIRELPELLAFILDLVVHELDVDRASLMLVDESGELRVSASHGIDDQVARDTRVRIEEGIVGRVVQTGEPLLVSDVSAGSTYVESPRDDLSNSFVSAPIKLSVPIKSDSTLGAINITNRRSGAPFGLEDVSYLMGLGGQVAVAIERARHLGHLQSAVESLEATRDQLDVANRRLQESNAGLEEAAKLKNQFLANTSHELRTPLSGILGSLQLILDKMCRTREEEHGFLEQAHQCAQKLNGLIDDLLAITNIEAATPETRGGAIDVRSLFEDVQRMTEVQAAQKGLAIRFEVVEPCVQKVLGDLGKVRQVLLNLVGNSIKFTLRGSITVRAVENPDQGHFLFEVVDTGIGVPSESLKSIFDTFTQVDGSHTREFGGNGLGLAISKGLVELMGGVIGVESEGENHGTRAYFSLPIWRANAEHDEQESVGPMAAGRIEGPIGGALVLIVEDDPMHRRYLATLLNRRGHRVIEATTAGVAWMLLRRLRPSVVLVDYALPAAGAAELRSGWDLAVKINRDPETRQTPVIFVTGYEIELGALQDQGVFFRPPAYVRKPVEAEKLLRQIEEMLGPRSQRPMRILLADSDSAMVVHVRNQLPAEEYLLEVAGGGEECLNVLRAQPHGFDLLVVDLSMPEVTGFDVLHEMKRAALAPNLPVVVIVEDPPTLDLERSTIRDRIAETIPRRALQADSSSLRDLARRYRDMSLEGGGELSRSEAA